MNATLSILGLYNYDNTVFDGLYTPPDLDKQTLIDYIMMECANLELLYPNFQLMKRLITSWAGARKHSWERLYQSTVQQYNMIHNYDRYEEWTDSHNSTNNGTETTSENSQSTGTHRSTDSTNSESSGVTDTSKAAYNSTDPLTLVESVNSNATAYSNGSGYDYNNNNVSVNENRTHNGSENADGTHSGHMYGNIGVTTAAQMLNEERELYKWDVYQAIAQEFKERFCILVY